MFGVCRLAVATSVLVGTVLSTELTKETWDNAVMGKTVFIKFQAPWCGHCKRMKPDWDKLMKEYEGSTTILVGDVDCTAAGKAKCDEVGVRGYPTIKHGDPNDLQDYKGGRSFDDLKKFAEGLGPQCSPANLDLCDDDKKKLIAEYMKLSEAEREKMIAEKEKKMETIEADFKTFVEGLQKSYQDASDAKDKNLDEIKSGGLGMLKSVNAYAKKQKSEL